MSHEGTCDCDNCVADFINAYDAAHTAEAGALAFVTLGASIARAVQFSVPPGYKPRPNWPRTFDLSEEEAEDDSAEAARIERWCDRREMGALR